MKVTIIVGMTPEGIIGKAGGLPWHLPADLRHFQRTTTGHAVVMGRKTWDSIRRPLPGRRNIVVSRSLSAQQGHAGLVGDAPPGSERTAKPSLDSAAREGAACKRRPGTALDFVDSLEAALTLCRRRSETEVFIVGGAQIYALALPIAVEMIVTWVDRPGITGDTYFPAWRMDQWEVVGEEQPLGDLTVRRYRRRA